MPSADANDATTHQRTRCEFGETLFAEGECHRFGEVHLDGSLLCAPHAKLLRLQAQESALLAKVFELNEWLDTPNNRADELRWRRVLRERDEALEELRFNRALIEANKEIDQER